MLFFYLAAAVAFVFILLSNPFLKIPYDPWEHLLVVVSLHDEGKSFIFWPGEEGGDITKAMYFWHQLWARIFRFTGINDIFLWAKIIHVVQFTLACLCVFYFSKTALSILTKHEPHTLKSSQKSLESSPLLAGMRDRGDMSRIRILSLFAVLLWIIGNGTFSMKYQQAWIMWYSLTYQGLTIPLLWYGAALTFKLTYEHLSIRQKLFHASQIGIISLIMVRVHPTELLYYLIFLFVLLLFNMKKLFSMENRKMKWVILIFIPLALLLLFILIRYLMPVEAPFFAWVSSGTSLSQMWIKANQIGNGIVRSGLNRFPNSFSEIALLSIIAALLVRVIYTVFSKERVISFNVHFFDYLLALSMLFFSIPMIPSLAGLIGYMTHPHHVWRFFFASPWFIFLPFVIYKLSIMKDINIPLYKFVIIAALVITSIFYFRKYIFHDTFILNTKSIVNSLYKEKIGVQYAKKDMDAIGDLIRQCEQIDQGKPNMYFTGEISAITGGVGDKAYIIRGVFRKYVYGSRRKNITIDSFYKNGLDKTYNLIDIDHPDACADRKL